MAKEEKSFAKKHWLGWAASIVTVFVAAITNNVYQAFRGPVEAQIAANQVNDSVTDFVLHQQMSYNNLVERGIGIAAFIMVMLFLLPTIIGAIKLIIGKNQED